MDATSDATTQQLLRALVAAGAEIEQRNADGTPTAVADDGTPRNVLPLAPDTCDIDEDHDPPQVWLRPVYGPDRHDPDGTPIYDRPHHQPQAVPYVRLDRLDGGTIGIAHADGHYSQVRPCTGPHADALATWNRGRLEP